MQSGTVWNALMYEGGELLRATAALRAGRLWGEVSIAVAGKWVVFKAESAFGYAASRGRYRHKRFLNSILNFDGVLSGAYRLNIIMYRREN